jgi:ubiquinone/menaquinone biosynthesis C-methylase UbiE
MSAGSENPKASMKIPEKTLINLNPMRRIFNKNHNRSRKQVEPFVSKGWIVADLGANNGYYTFGLAKGVGPEGMVIAVELNDKLVRRIRKKIKGGGYHNINLHAASAEDLNFIDDNSIDFVLANGLLCEMVGTREKAVKEIKRILKPDHIAFLSLGSPPPLGKVNGKEWESILKGFKVHRRGGRLQKWAIVSVKV